MFNLHEQSERYGIRPSRILGIRSRYLAHQFDEVVFLFGRRTQERLKERRKVEREKGKVEFVAAYDLYSALEIPRPVKPVNVAALVAMGALEVVRGD